MKLSIETSLKLSIWNEQSIKIQNLGLKLKWLKRKYSHKAPKFEFAFASDFFPNHLNLFVASIRKTIKYKTKIGWAPNKYKTNWEHPVA